MVHVLIPQRIDESLHTTLREKNYSEKMNKMQRGELPEFEACFTFSCPKVQQCEEFFKRANFYSSVPVAGAPGLRHD